MHLIILCSHFQIVEISTDSSAFGKSSCNPASIIAMLMKIVFHSTPKILSSQWNFGRKMQRCPAASIVFWTRDLWARKSGWCSRVWVAHHDIEVGSHFGSQQMRSIPWHQRLCPLRTTFIPFGWSGQVGWLGGKTIGYETHTLLQANHPSQRQGTLPPGFRFMFWTHNASFGHAEWPCELSIMIRAW